MQAIGEEKESKLLFVIAMALLLIPGIIFLMGWIKIYIAIPLSLMLLLGAVWVFRKTEPLWVPQWNRSNMIKIILVLMVIAVWVYLSGIGKLFGVFQNSDHYVRNGIFNAMVNHEWPVRIENRLLVYYIGFWMPSALFGKIFGLNAGFLAQYIYAVLMIFFTYYFICVPHKKILIWPLFVLILFSGFDIIGTYIYPIEFDLCTHLEWWMYDGNVQYSSFTTQLFFVFNQAVPAWLVVAMINASKGEIGNYVYLLALLFSFSPFPVIGLVFVILGIFVQRVCTYLREEHSAKSELIAFVRNNVLQVVSSLVFGIVLSLYYTANRIFNNVKNVSGEAASITHTVDQIAGKKVGEGFSINYDLSIREWLLFILLEFGLYAIFLWKDNKKNIVFYSCLTILCILPFFNIGHNNDLVMRASIPPLFMLVIYTIDALYKNYRRNHVIWAGLCVLLLIGAVTPIHEISRTVYETKIAYEENRSASREIYPEENFIGGYFLVESTDSLFIRYLCR